MTTTDNMMIDTYASTCDMVNTRLHNDCAVDERADMYFLRQSECERFVAVYYTSSPRQWGLMDLTEGTPIVFLEPETKIITILDLEQPEVDLTKFLFQHLWDNDNGDSLLANELQIVDTRDFEEQFLGGDDPIPF